VVGLSDGFQMPENIFPYFSLEEKLMRNLIEVVLYFLEHVWIIYEFSESEVRRSLLVLIGTIVMNWSMSFNGANKVQKVIL